MSRVLLAVLATLALAACSGSPDAAAPSPGPSREVSPAREVSPPSSGSPSARSSPSRSASSPTGKGWTRALPEFAARSTPITPALERRMRWSHRAGCPVPLGDLRHLRVSFVGFDGAARTGELVVHRDVADDVVSVFRTLYAARWPIARMRLVDAYRGDDDLSMAANNTSAYNCRRVAGSTSWSEHAFGRAIDVNPVQNPYVQPGSVDPDEGRRYADLDRSAGARVPQGVVRAGDVVVRAFAEIGWEWGGHWTSSKDYQHFSLSGR